MAGVCMSSIVWFTTARSASLPSGFAPDHGETLLTNIVSKVESGEHFNFSVRLDLADDFHIEISHIAVLLHRC
jgi:hypothetical protein